MKKEDHASYVSKELSKKYAKEQHDKYKDNPKYHSLKSALGKQGAIDALSHQERNMAEAELVNKAMK
jgi:hypothetical protein